MQTYHIETVVSEKGVLTIKGLPFQPGEKVEIIVKSRWTDDKIPNHHYPLRGKLIRYKNPFDSVAENEWDVIDDNS
jgi:hypothetical protein